MSIEFKTGNIFDSECSCLVNPVNSVGVMGAGLAKEFKSRFPDMFTEYKWLCDRKNLYPGKVKLWRSSPTSVVFFATKCHWEEKSTLYRVEQGLETFVWYIKIGDWNIDSVAFPKLGCGLGGLDWEKVKLIMVKHLSKISDEVKVEIWE